MRFSRLILCGLLAVTLTATAEAGPLRRLAQRIRGGGCASAAVQTGPTAAPVVMPQTGTLQLVHGTSYAPPAAGGGPSYPAIRLAGPLPCVGGACGR
jgi:hypothetical protein